MYVYMCVRVSTKNLFIWLYFHLWYDISLFSVHKATIVAIMLLDKLVKREKKLKLTKTYSTKTSLPGLQIIDSLLVCFS